MTRKLIPLFVAITLFAAACGDDASDAESGDGPDTTTSTTVPVNDGSPAPRLATARTLWAENGPASYLLTTRQLCFCPDSSWIDMVSNGELTDHVALGEDSFFDPGGKTMESLFDEIDEAIADGFATLDLEFDPTTGAVVRYWVDVDERIADEEHGVEVVSLEPLGRDGVDIDVGALTNDYSCGYGFALGSPAQNLGLVISFDDFTSPDVSAPVTFPSDQWVGEIRIGSDLFANWCDDLIEDSDPAPVINRRLKLAGGTLTITHPAEDADCNSTTVTATLADGMVQTFDGFILELGTLDLSNARWGCFAG